jgi:hypothetical protein
MPLPRSSFLYLLPVGVVLTALFGAYYAYWGVIALRAGNVPFALFYGLFGLGGVVLSLALWRVWQQLRRAAR